MGKRKPGRKYRTPALPWEKIQKTKPVTMLRAIKRLLILSHKKSIRTAMPEMAKSSKAEILIENTDLGVG